MLGHKIAFPSRLILTCLTATGLLLSACTPGGEAKAGPLDTPRPTRAGQLTPYTAPSTTATQPPAALVTTTPLPSPTPTPRTHVVKKGEDMGGIAWMYRVSLEDLMSANPEVDPHIMSVDTVLVIPPSKTPMPEEAVSAEGSQPTPTAIPLEAGGVNCVRAEDGGVWCFLPVRNPQDIPLESITAVIRLGGSQGEEVVFQTATLPLDTLPPGKSLALAAYFPPEQVAPLTPPYTISSEIISALPNPQDGRYLPVRLEHTKFMLAENSLSARVSTVVHLDQPTGKAQRLWIAATAYDVEENVVGIRRWEMDSAQPLESGQALPVTFNIYSAAGEIERIELLAEARP